MQQRSSVHIYVYIHIYVHIYVCMKESSCGDIVCVCMWWNYHSNFMHMCTYVCIQLYIYLCMFVFSRKFRDGLDIYNMYLFAMN